MLQAHALFPKPCYTLDLLVRYLAPPPFVSIYYPLCKLRSPFHSSLASRENFSTASLSALSFGQAEGPESINALQASIYPVLIIWQESPISIISHPSPSVPCCTWM